MRKKTGKNKLPYKKPEKYMAIIMKNQRRKNCRKKTKKKKGQYGKPEKTLAI